MKVPHTHRMPLAIYNLFLRNATVNRVVKTHSESSYETCLESALEALSAESERNKYILDRYVEKFGNGALQHFVEREGENNADR